MTIDEAIKHCEEVAEKQEITARSNLIEIDKIKVDGILRIYDADEYESCMKCASEHRQLAEWLKELKSYKEHQPNEDTLEKIRAEIEKKRARAKQMSSVLQMNAYTDCLHIIDKYKEDKV